MLITYHTRLEALLPILAPRASTPLTLELTDKENCYSDGEHLVVGLFHYLHQSSNEKIYSTLLALTAHEAGHANYSDGYLFQHVLEEWVPRWRRYTGVSSEHLFHVGQYLINGLEDGRVEFLQKQRLPGLIPHFESMREEWWNHHELPPNATPYQAWTYGYLTLATCRKYPKGFSASSFSDVFENLESIRPLLMRAIKCETFLDCVSIIPTLFERATPFLCQHFPFESAEPLTNYEPRHQTDVASIRQSAQNSSLSTPSEENNATQSTTSTASLDKDTSSISSFYPHSQAEITSSSPSIPLDSNEFLMSSLFLIPFQEVPFRLNTTPIPFQLQIEGQQLHSHLKQLIDSGKMEDGYRHSTGRLSTQNLWRLSYHETRLFTHTLSKDESVVISLLVDGSGSMNTPTYFQGNASTRFQDALRAAAIIEEGCRDLIPLSICVFTERESVVHHLVKPFESYRDNQSWGFFSTSPHAYHRNNDAVSILRVGEELKKRTESRKILLVLSDGTPAFTDSAYQTQQVVRHLKQDQIQVVGIGMGDSTPDSEALYRYMYEQDFITATPDNLTTTLIQTVSRWI